ncbi:MAG: transporter substrate-binding domain-containing protein [Candidatus Nealsonbacteria bacterium]|nr:transporter substrate-binding domain-containing protein [Candidatus Nealsonbacteria bacterium]
MYRYQENRRRREKKSIPAIIIGLLLLAGALYFTVPASVAKISEPKGVPLIVGTSTPFEPFEAKKGNEIMGVDIDIAKEVAKKLGRSLVVKDMEFDVLLHALNQSQVHMVASGLTITEERDKKEGVDFSIPYYEIDQGVLTSNNAFLCQNTCEPKDFVGMKVGFQQGTTSQDWILDNLVNKTEVARFEAFGDLKDAIQMLREGSLDVIIIDYPVAKLLAIQELRVAGKIETHEQYGIAVKEGDPEKLLLTINAVLKEMKGKGEINKLVEKYQPKPEPESKDKKGAQAIQPFGIPKAFADHKKYPDRGKYIYDAGERLSINEKADLAARLWNLDVRTDHEVLVVLPKEKPESELDLIDSFRKLGVGKDMHNGIALFILPDNAWFVGIGMGNQYFSIHEARDFGEVNGSLNDIGSVGLAKSLQKFVTSVDKDIKASVDLETQESWGVGALEWGPVVTGWISIGALGIFLFKQRDGYQNTDLIGPIICFLFLIGFFGAAAASASGEFDSYTNYGYVTSTKLSSKLHTHTHVVSTGKTTRVYYTYHTHYYNDVRLLSYEKKQYSHTFFSEDSKSAWEHKIGEVDSLEINLKNDVLVGVGVVQDPGGHKEEVINTLWGKR